MPFELGIDYGNYKFKNDHKKMVILEGCRYDYHKSLSDLSGVDIKCHENNPTTLIRCIREWFIGSNMLNKAPSTTTIWYKFTDFTSDFYNQRIAEGFSHEESNDLPTNEYISSITEWVSDVSRDTSYER